MSLLTSDDSRNATNLVRHLVNFCSFLSILSFLAGLGYFAYLIQEPDQTYFSDNALLPGLATRTYSTDSNVADQCLKDLENITNKSFDVDSDRKQKIIHESIQYLRGKFEKYGLSFYEHDFQHRYPFCPQCPVENGKNVYAILRAPRASSTEAIVISTSFLFPVSGNISKKNNKSTTLPSVSLMLSLAKFFQTKNYWAKDLIFLISFQELIGIQAWLNAYHGLDHSDLSSSLKQHHFFRTGTLRSTAGTIQAAINLEIGSFNPKAVEIKIEGINGQLPNLDLFNVAVELCNREGVPATFHRDSFHLSADPWLNWLRNWATISSMMSTLASTRPTGSHGLFQRFAIQSITLETVAKQNRNDYSIITSVNIGRSIEGIVRSLNNLLERFNRSYYFYLLPSTRRYISIAFYMICFVMLALPLALKALQLYFKANRESSKKSSKKSSASSSPFDLWSSFQANFISHMAGIVTLSVPILLARFESISTTFLVPVESLPSLIFTIFVTLSLVFAFLVPNNFLDLVKTESQLALQSMLALLNLLLLLGCVSLVNISLALALTLVYVPSSMLILLLHSNYKIGSQQQRRSLGPKLVHSVKKGSQFTLLLLTHPLVLLFLGLLIRSVYSSNRLILSKSPSSTLTSIFNIVLSKNIPESFAEELKLIMDYLEEWYYFDNWTFSLVSLFLFPVWLQFWYTSISQVNRLEKISK